MLMNCQGSLIKFCFFFVFCFFFFGGGGGNLAMDKHFFQGGVEILLVASC